jgi:transposase InsO family protein
VDCKTDWPDVIELGKDTTANKLISVLRDQFCRTAAPDVLWSDGGPQFKSHLFAEFLVSWGVYHNTSSPHYPQSNGKVEATVKKSSRQPGQVAHLTSRSSPVRCFSIATQPCRKDGTSPTQKLFGHPIQDTLPAHRRSLAPE